MTNRVWHDRENSLLTAVVFSRFISHGDLYPTTTAELNEMNKDKHIWLSDDVDEELLSWDRDMRRETLTWMVIAKVYNAVAEEVVPAPMPARSP